MGLSQSTLGQGLQANQATLTTKEERELGKLKALLGSLSKRTLEKVQTQAMTGSLTS